MAEHQKKLNRRSFLKGAAALGTTLAFPAIIPASARGADGHVAPSNRIVFGFIGLGGKGMGNLNGFLIYPDVQVVALCDVDRKHLESAHRTVQRKYGTNACQGYADFRELTARTDLDAVCVSTPDHWHTLAALAVVRSGKDAYVEKPLTLNIKEGRVLSDEVRRLGRILQTGSQQRSDDRFRTAAELVRNGRIGRIQEIQVGIPGNNRVAPTWQPEPVPPELDYEMWLGQAPWAPYSTQRCHYTFRFIRDYSGGQVTNWGAHHIDIAQWGLGMDASGPIQVVGHGEYPDEGLFNTATKVHFECTYANGVRLTCATMGKENDATRSGTTFIGTEGRIHVNRGLLEADRPELLREGLAPGEVHLYKSRDHFRNFVDCVISRQTPITDVEIGHRTATICHLGNIAMLLGRPLKWDPVAERIVGDESADAMCGQAPRAPWHLV